MSSHSEITVPRILVAEDHAPTRFVLTALLEKNGYTVQEVSEGNAALEALDSPEGPTIALLDWGLPNKSGPEICRSIRDRYRQRFIYFIIVTARDTAEDLAAAIEAGADDFVRKPFDPVEILARLRGGLRIVELEQRLSRRIVECEEAIDNIRQLKRLLPICMYCKKVRDDSQYWQEIEHYIHKQTGTDFSHGICPCCMEEVRAGQEPAESRRPNFRL